MTRLLPYLKAIYGSLLTALATVAQAYITTGTVPPRSAVTAGLAFLVSLGVIWGVPNATKAVAVRIGPHLEDK